MAILHGKGGKVLIAAAQLESVESWSGDFSYKYDDATAMGQSATAKITGLADGKATVTCFRDSTAVNQNALIAASLAGTAQTVKLYENSAKFYQMVALVSYSVSTAVGGVEKITFSFENSNGALPSYN